MNYDKLIENLRYEASYAYLGSDGERLAKMMRDASDAIEELSREYDSVSKSFCESVELVRKLQPKVQRWISVKERLPEPYTRVIGYMAWKAITAIEFQNNHWYSIDHLEPLPDEAVTHWMPLPQPPKEDEA